MLKAGSLLYAIGICLVMALITGSIILFSYYNRIQLDDYILIEKVNKNVISGMNYLLTINEMNLNEKKYVDLFAQGNDTVDLELRNWGVFHLAISHSNSKNIEAGQKALIGNRIPSEDRVALYFADRNKPISLCGNTFIMGNCYLPKLGARNATIEGQGYSGDLLIHGQVKNSDNSIPSPSKKFIEEIKQNISINVQNEDSLIQWEQIQTNSSIFNSFSSPTLFLFSDKPIIIDGRNIMGRVKIVSKKSIKVLSNSNLDDVILISPKIELEDNFQGSIQCFADDSILIGQNCSLRYPSSLNILRGDNQLMNSIISLGEKDSIVGDIILYDPYESINKLSLIKVEKDAVITGQVYTFGAIDIKGKIFGSLFTNKVILVTPSSVYDNYLFNVTIDGSKLSKLYVGGLWSDINELEVVKYLN